MVKKKKTKDGTIVIPEQLSTKLKRIQFLQKPIQPAPQLTKEQNMLHEMFGGEPTFGTGENLPKIDGVLNSGHGLIKNDDYGETGSMFGFRRQR